MPLTLNPADIAGLATPIAQHGAIRAMEAVSDDLYELLISIAILIYETNPG